LVAAVDDWHAHKHPSTWQKRPQEQPRILLGGFSSSLKNYGLSI
jgi:hypothetical protein